MPEMKLQTCLASKNDKLMLKYKKHKMLFQKFIIEIALFVFIS